MLDVLEEATLEEEHWKHAWKEGRWGPNRQAKKRFMDVATEDTKVVGVREEEAEGKFRLRQTIGCYQNRPMLCSVSIARVVLEIPFKSEDKKVPDECFAAGALGAVVQNILQGQREGQALRVWDVQVRDVVQVVHAHEHLVLRRVRDVVLLQVKRVS